MKRLISYQWCIFLWALCIVACVGCGSGSPDSVSPTVTVIQDVEDPYIGALSLTLVMGCLSDHIKRDSHSIPGGLGLTEEGDNPENRCFQVCDIYRQAEAHGDEILEEFWIQLQALIEEMMEMREDFDCDHSLGSVSGQSPSPDLDGCSRSGAGLNAELLVEIINSCEQNYSS